MRLPKGRFHKDITFEGIQYRIHWDFEGRDPSIYDLTDWSEDIFIEIDDVGESKLLDFITGDDITDAVNWLSAPDDY